MRRQDRPAFAARLKGYVFAANDELLQEFLATYTEGERGEVTVLFDGDDLIVALITSHGRRLERRLPLFATGTLH